MFLKCVLHFNNELFALLILAVYVENSLAVCINVSHVLAIEIFHVFDNLLFSEQRVQEVYEQVFIEGGSKYALETEVCQQTDISFFRLSHIVCI